MATLKQNNQRRAYNEKRHSDAVLVRQTVKVSGIDGIALTKLDVLDGLKELKICTGYTSPERDDTIVVRDPFAD